MMQPQKPELPDYLKPKKTYSVDGPMKRANWKAIVPQKLSKNSFWVQVNEDQLYEHNKDIIAGLTSKFSSKPPSKKTTEKDSLDKPMTIKKSVVDLRVLDAKAAQNISILLGGSLKHLSYEQIKFYLLRCDMSNLNATILQQMIQYLPPPDHLKRLQELKAAGEELSGAEQFCATIAEIKRLNARLQSLLFRLNFSDILNDIKPDISAVTYACKEVRDCQEFQKILEIILLFGNYMNSGSKNEAAFGFEISFLTKLTSTKDFENKQTLLHYIVEIVETKFPECLEFPSKIPNLDKASRVSIETVLKSFRQFKASHKNLESDLNNNKVPQGPDDFFHDVMGKFLHDCEEAVGILTQMQVKMESNYKELAEFYAFDTNKYTVEEFFSDLKTFRDAFVQALSDNRKIRELELKELKARKAREEAQKMQGAPKKNIIINMDMDSEQAQEGVVDNLLLALTSGTAFSTREPRKKRGARPAGNFDFFFLLPLHLLLIFLLFFPQIRR